MNKIILESTIVCPECGFSKTEQMPTDACLWFYECQSCHSLLKPKNGDCCVFCSYGSVPCPPVQQQTWQALGLLRLIRYERSIDNIIDGLDGTGGGCRT